MRLLVVSLLSTLSLGACGPFITTDSLETAEYGKFNSEKFAFLSDNAKANGMLLKAHMKSLWQKKKAICGISAAIPDNIREQTKAIRKNNELDRDSKKQQIMSLKAPFKKAKEAHKAAMVKCKAEKMNELAPINDKMKALKSACLPAAFNQKDGEKKGNMKRFWVMLKNMDDAGKAELNTTLGSNSCADALK